MPTCQYRHVTARKTDAERGPLGTWAYRTRDLLDLTVEVVAERIGASAATIRKIEGGSNAKPSARMLRDLYAVYLHAAEDRPRPIAIEPPPGMAPEVPAPNASGMEAMVAVFARQAAALEEQNAIMREQLAEMRRQNDLLSAMAFRRSSDANDPTVESLRAALEAYQPDVLPTPSSDPTPDRRKAPER